METVILVKRMVKRRYQKDSWMIKDAYLLVSSESRDRVRSFDHINLEEEFPDLIALIELVMNQLKLVFVPALGIRLEINETKVVWPMHVLQKIKGMKIETLSIK